MFRKRSRQANAYSFPSIPERAHPRAVKTPDESTEENGLLDGVGARVECGRHRSRALGNVAACLAFAAGSSAGLRLWEAGRSLLLSVCTSLYRPRRPQDSPLYRLVDEFNQEVKGAWEERFERTYGFWRGFVDDVVLAFQACGGLEGGFARVYCDDCRADFLIAFSCSRRVFCPSCAAKRAAIFGAARRDEGG